MNDVIYCNNAMLNLPGFNSTAAMSMRLELGSGWPTEDEKESSPSLSGSLCISDCNRVIELDCYASTKEEYANVLHKLATLANNIQQAHFNLKARQDEFNAKYDRVDAIQKAKKEANNTLKQVE